MLWARYAAVAVLLTSSVYCADKKGDCYHLMSDPLRQVYSHSPFAHGLRHGYEAGFHDADLDYHLGYDERQLLLNKVPGTEGFQKSFGDKKSFRRGYEYGYLAGYHDSFAGRKFHYPLPADGVPAELASTRAFDTGVADGFRARVEDAEVRTDCANAQPGYCEGFRLGAKFATEEHHGGGVSVASKAITDQRR
jgi:hypothetical protein